MSNLRTFRDWCRAMANDGTIRAGERALWADLAARIDRYLKEPR